MKQLFDDPVYSKDDLELTLFKSFDLHVDPGRCFEEPGVAEVRTSIVVPGDDSVYKEYTHTSATDVFVYTIPYGRPIYIARAVALSAQGAELQSSEKELDLSSKRYGHDQIWRPNCVAELSITVTFPEGTPLERGESNPVRIRVEVAQEDGSFAPVENAQLDILYFADEARRLLGTTDGDGYFEESILADADIITLQIDASHPDGRAGYFFRDYEAGPTMVGGGVRLVGFGLGNVGTPSGITLFGEVNVEGAENPEPISVQELLSLDEPVFPVDIPLRTETREAAAEGRRLRVQLSASLSATVQVDEETAEVAQVSVQLSAASNLTAVAPPDGNWGQSDHDGIAVSDLVLVFEAVDANARLTISGTQQVEGNAGSLIYRYDDGPTGPLFTDAVVFEEPGAFSQTYEYAPGVYYIRVGSLAAQDEGSDFETVTYSASASFTLDFTGTQ